jgi:hypothetical protein
MLCCGFFFGWNDAKFQSAKKIIKKICYNFFVKFGHTPLGVKPHLDKFLLLGLNRSQCCGSQHSITFEHGMPHITAHRYVVSASSRVHHIIWSQMQCTNLPTSIRIHPPCVKSQSTSIRICPSCTQELANECKNPPYKIVLCACTLHGLRYPSFTLKKHFSEGLYHNWGDPRTPITLGYPTRLTYLGWLRWVECTTHLQDLGLVGCIVQTCVYPSWPNW